MLRLNEIYRSNDFRRYNAALATLCLFLGLISFQAWTLFQIGEYLAFGIFIASLIGLGYLHAVTKAKKNIFMVDFRHVSFLLVLGVCMIVISSLV